MILYVQEQGAVLQRRGDNIEIRQKGDLLYRAPIIGISRVVVIGYIQVTTQAIHVLARQGIDVVYLTANQRNVCTMYSNKTDNVFLRLAQMQRFEDKAYRLQFAKQIADGKLMRQKEVICAHKWNSSFDWRNQINNIMELQSSLPKRETLEEVRGVEGSASRAYFACFAEMLTKLSFGGRTRRPAKDEVNALLNLGYTMLCNECTALLDACGLDSAIGFMHGVVYGRKSLALDFMEVFRADVVDRLVLRLVNWGMIGQADFKKDEKIGYRLNPEGFKTFITQYERHMEHKPHNESQSLREVIKEETQRLRYAVLNGTLFQPWDGDV